MTVFYSNASIREVLLGVNVSRATAVLPTAVQSPQTIYTITGGRILLVSLVGQVTTVIGGNAQTLKVSVSAAAAGSAPLDLCAPSVNIATAAVGTHFALPGTTSDQLITDMGVLSGVPLMDLRQMADVGSVTLTSTGTNTGSVQWDLIYVPLDVGSLVVAA